jgi:hypothetical protein
MDFISTMEVKLRAFLNFNMNISVTTRPFRHQLKNVLVLSGQEAPTDYVTPTFVPVIKLAEFLVPLRAAKSLF